MKFLYTIVALGILGAPVCASTSSEVELISPSSRDLYCLSDNYGKLVYNVRRMNLNMKTKNGIKWIHRAGIQCSMFEENDLWLLQESGLRISHGNYSRCVHFKEYLPRDNVVRSKYELALEDKIYLWDWGPCKE